ncbi:hypothetical protein EDB80DRAFT_894587 [Ilyonectria destructans]|nr:hypothetical protein EDB80DRAFT_894587 [Ilyonectria destructans]
MAVHGVKQTPPSSRRSTISGAISTPGSAKSLTGYAPDATGICSTCSVTFSNAQDFYEHLDDCLLLIVLQGVFSEAINAKRLAAPVDEHVRDTPGKSRLPTGHFVSGPGDEAKGREGVDGEGQMMKQRAMTLFDGPRRLAKDDNMLSTDHELRIKLLYGKPQPIGPHVQTHEAAEGVPIAAPTDDELHLILDEEMQSAIEVADTLVHSTAPDVANQSTERTEPNTASERLSTKTSVSTIISNDNQQPADSEDLTGPEAFKVSLQHKVEDHIVRVGMPGTYGMSFPALHAAEMSGCTTDGSESFTSCSSPEDSPSPGKIASSKKEVIIKRILGRFKTWLDSRLTLLAYQLDSSGPPFGLNDNSAILDQNAGQPGQTARGDKRGRDSDDPGGSDDGKDDQDRKGSREPKRVKMGQGDGLDFACPFLKHNVRKYQTKRCCAWSGWKTVHRVKEHVYRKHRLPQSKCNRCCCEFQNSTQLADHQRLEVPCNIRLQDPQDGVNEEQILALRSRKKAKGNTSESEKWANMYKIIFPDDDLVPSPYHDIQFQLDEKDPSGHVDTNLLRDLGNHARRELPRLMRPRLEDMLDQVIEEGLTPDRVVNLAQGVFQQILQTFRLSEVDHEQPGGDGFHVPCGPLQGNTNLATSQGVSLLHDGLAGPETCVESEANSSFANGGPMPCVPQGLFDIIQDTMIHSLGTTQYDFEELLRFPGEGFGQLDSGYGSLERNSASDLGNEKD